MLNVCDECGANTTVASGHSDQCQFSLAAKERRRYALLQAAATIYGGSYNDDIGAFDTTHVDSVVTAEMLLAEIERRETEQK